MGFSANQLRALRRDVDRRNLRTRKLQNGRALTYIEGWHAVAEANRIFGFGGWDRETVESRCILAREIKGVFTAIYAARVRITVRTNGETVVREGHGTGDGKGELPGEAHDMAIKTAETDATKRALATFGKPFGLSLYLSSRPRRQSEKPSTERSTVTRPSIMPASIPATSPGSSSTPSTAEPARISVTGAPDHERRRTLQRLGPNGRFYVPPNGQPTSDSFHKILADEETAKKRDNAENGSGPADLKPEPLAKASSADGSNDGTVLKTLSAETASPDDIRASVAKETAFLIAHPRRARDKDHLLFVGKQPCLLCGRTPSDAHHLRFAQPRAMSKKVSDEFTVPLCRIHHRQLHHAGDEASWWNDVGVDPLPIAQELWQQSRGQTENDGATATINGTPEQTAHDARKTPA